MFMHHPVGLMAEGEPHVRSPQRVEGEAMYFYCNVKEGIARSVLESTDIMTDTRSALADKEREMSGIGAFINFHCILQTLELEVLGLTEDYGRIFADIPPIGFSTYNEEFIGHINQTPTMLAFRKA
jgi:hypothetical protein